VPPHLPPDLRLCQADEPIHRSVMSASWATLVPPKEGAERRCECGRSFGKGCFWPFPTEHPDCRCASQGQQQTESYEGPSKEVQSPLPSLVLDNYIGVIRC